MKPITAVLATATVALACNSASAAEPDLVAETTEWVFEPCMEVAAALDVKTYDREAIDTGVKRTHIAQVMLASREAAIQQVVSKMRAGTSWEARRAAYPTMLKLCIAQFENK